MDLPGKHADMGATTSCNAAALTPPTQSKKPKCRIKRITMTSENARRTRIQQENRERILKAALDMFSRSGYRGTTLDEIAAAASMSKPNMLYYFPTKQELYRTVLQATLDDWLTPFSKLDPQGDPASELGAYISAKLAHARLNPKASRLFANEILQGAPLLEGTLKGPLKNWLKQNRGQSGRGSPTARWSRSIRCI